MRKLAAFGGSDARGRMLEFDAAKAKANVEATKNDPKAVKPDMKSKEVQKAMQKAATP